MPDYDVYEKYVKCPFYVKVDQAPSIYCEGVTNESLCMKPFSDRAELKKWFRKNCCREPAICPVYSGIVRAKYAEVSPPLLRGPKKTMK